MITCAKDYSIRFLCLFSIIIFGTVCSYAYNEHVTSWPTDGLVSHWDLHVDYQRDLVSGVKRDTTNCYRSTGFRKSYVANGTMFIPLPTDIWEVHKPHTLLLRLVNYADIDLEELEISLPLGVSADDDALEFVLYHDSLLSGAQTEYELPLLWTPYSSEKRSSKEAVVAVFLECMERNDTLHRHSRDAYIRSCNYFAIRTGFAAKNKYVIGYAGVAVDRSPELTLKIHCQEGWSIGSAQSIDFNEVAIYDRILTPEEIRVAIGAEKMKVMIPETYEPYFGWVVAPYIVLSIVLFILMLLLETRKYNYISVARLHRSKGFKDKEMAYSLIEEANACFISDEAMKVPTIDRLKHAEKCLNLTIKNGYCDDNIIAECNRIASLINFCRRDEDDNMGRYLVFAIPFIIAFGAIVTGYDYGTFYIIWDKPEMYPYYITSALAAIVSQVIPIDSVKLAGAPIYTNKVKWLKPNILSRLGDRMMGFVNVGSGIFVSGISGIVVALRVLFVVLAYTIALTLKVMLSSLYEFVVVVKGTGQVVAEGIGGMFSGLVFGAAVFSLLLWLFFKLAWLLINGLLWIAIPGIGAISAIVVIFTIIRMIRHRL